MDLSVIDKLNEKRREIIKRIINAWAIAFGVFVLGAFINPVVSLIAGILIGSLGTAFCGKKKFVQDYKNIVLTTAFDAAFDDCKYDFEHGFDREFVMDTKLVNQGNTYRSDDYISGYYNGLHFVRADVDVKQVTSTGKSATVIPIFVGQWMIFDLPKKFNSTTKVVENEFFKAGNPGGLFQDMKRINTESIDFNKKYSIFTNNEHDAFYLLTPQLMEKILLLEKKYDKIRIGFIDGKIHILFETNKNFYEPSIFTDIDSSSLKELAEQINVIKDMANILQLEGDDSNDFSASSCDSSSSRDSMDATINSVR